jgi:anthranilate synthase/aminodeoxychorismate synthase-like glutamine amidotransferase
LILLIDNYDSFVHNLARYFRRLGEKTLVVRNDAIQAGQIPAMEAKAVVISPGPCTPLEAGCSLEVVERLAGTIPVLGVCLGHQAIGMACGARLVRAPEPVHGRTSLVRHDGRGLFAGLASPLRVCRYHSLVVDRSSLPDELTVTAETDEGLVMGLAHRTHRVYGVQFHPEAILTERGFSLLANFLRLASDSPVSQNLADAFQDELTAAPAGGSPLPTRPVTF